MIDYLVAGRFSEPQWRSAEPIREELFGLERLEEHATSLALAQRVSGRAPYVLPLHKRLNDNANALLSAYQASAAELEKGEAVVPAAEWLLDNYHLVEAQIREIRDDLPPSYYRQLPKLSVGPFAGYPRVFGIAWAYIAHTDSHVDLSILIRFIRVYQQTQPLTIGELWAVAITLRIVLIENLRRLADQITVGRAERHDADALTTALLMSGCASTALQQDIATRSPQPLSVDFAAQLVKRLRNQDPKTTPALEWLEFRLKRQHLTVEQVVESSQKRQGASNLSIRNVITSMRLISDVDWAELFEKVSLVDKHLARQSGYGLMDFASRNLYRSAIEQLARGSHLSEVDIAEHAIDLAQNSKTAYQHEKSSELTDIEINRHSDPGYYLIDDGRSALEQEIEFSPTLGLRLRRALIATGVAGYSLLIGLLTLSLLGSVLFISEFAQLPVSMWIAWLLLGFIPVSDVATSIINCIVTIRFAGTTLPGLELKSGVPSSLSTMIVVPTLLNTEAELLAQIEQLEVHYLSGIDGVVSFALLTDGMDANQQELASDKVLLGMAVREIATLNARYATEQSDQRFMLLHRRRLYNPSENVWMGWERKRGKIRELNRLLRGATDTSFIAVNGQEPTVPKDVRYVITLDADTRLPRESAMRLIGKMAHPLNRPRFDIQGQRVVKGYGILQPRVTPSLSIGHEGSWYQQVFSAPGGIDPYAATISDVYQDLFSEGSFTGKGIYDVDMFEASLAGRVSENSMLSHDLFEGIFARAGLVSDVEVVEEFPARYDVAAKREHRWNRGDWQLLPWITGHRDEAKGMTCLGRWKLIDNLRRSLVSPLLMLMFALSWFLPFNGAIVMTGIIILTIAIPVFIPTLFSFLPHHSGVGLRHHLRLWVGDVQVALSQTYLSLAFLPDKACRHIDAIARALTRQWLTHQHCLEWTTAAHCNCKPRLSGVGFYVSMLAEVLLASIICTAAWLYQPTHWPLILPFALLWLASPMIAFWASRPQKTPFRDPLGDSAITLRLTARKTWRYFEHFVTPTLNMLPPDNFQEEPKPVVAQRTSPTNIGLYFLSAAVARDFGWAGLLETIDRFEASFTSLNKLTTYQGHFFNWYDIHNLTPLLPEYISSVDSGNFAGHLIALANSLEEWCEDPLVSEFSCGLHDNLLLLRHCVNQVQSEDETETLSAALNEISVALTGASGPIAKLATLNPLVNKTLMLTEQLTERLTDNPQLSKQKYLPEDLLFWAHALQSVVIEQQRDQQAWHDEPDLIIKRLTQLASSARQMACSMDFGFLIDPQRKLLSIGYSLEENTLDPSCYDLLASEARLASLFAIAKGDAMTKHWFRLGRTATPVGNGSALLSWSGSMFEYLMPSLVMRAPLGSLLEQTNRLIVQYQQEYAANLSIPWGVSESAYHARDIEFTYQYSNFGVPGLGLKRGLAQNTVIAPYATGLASMIDPYGAVLNFNHLTSLGAAGRFGFYEAIDFTPARLPFDNALVVIKSYMAHHQGMTIVAIANALKDGVMRERFHREPMIQACELLLQERLPRDVSINHPRAEEVRQSVAALTSKTPTVRHLSPLADGAPVTHLLSNGRYAIMLTATGAGYSHWQEFAISRWQEDTTCDPYGSFIFLRDIDTGQLWSSCAQPLGCENSGLNGLFEEDHAQFVCHDADLTTTTDVLVSGEDDGEVRRVTLSNNGRKNREIELTSYIELVLSKAQADHAHPAFIKMFVQTEYIPEYQALIATRRLRSADESPIWVAHFAVVEGQTQGLVQYETNRGLFIGRGNSVSTAAAFSLVIPSSTAASERHYLSPQLSNTVGSVLDPIFSLRYRVLIPAGGLVRVSFWTVVASSRAELMDLIDRHHDRSAYDRAKTLSWTQAQVQLRHLGISPSEADTFQRLAAPLLYCDPRFRISALAIGRGMASQSELWHYSIGGDLPIVLLHIDDIEDIVQVTQLLRAHEYWRMKRLAVDVVILNEHTSSYRQTLQAAIETAVRSSQSRPRLTVEFNDQQVKGSIHTLRADLMTTKALAGLKSAARVVLIARLGSIGKQIARLPSPPIWQRRAQASCNSTTAQATPPTQTQKASQGDQVRIDALKKRLEFFNGLGGFGLDGREYSIILQHGASTPAPWINVIANPYFGFHVAGEGGGFTWAQNSRESQLTPWCNDPISNPVGEAIFVRDEDTLKLYAATAQPLQDKIGTNKIDRGAFFAHHGRGYSRFEHQEDDLELCLLQYVPLNDPIKISRLRIHNHGSKPRHLSVTAYHDWVLGTSRSGTGPFISSELDEGSLALLLQNRWSVGFSERVAFADLSAKQTSWTTDRTEFIGRNGHLSSPAALLAHTPLSGTVGAGHDPCTAQQCEIVLPANSSDEIVVFIGQCSSAEKARALIVRYREMDLDAVLEDVHSHWSSLLGMVEVKTPDRASDIMLNGWLLYQTIACRMWARTAFYQASGAFGFRDQLQDTMALTFRRPDMTRVHLLRAAGRQFVEGDVQHWWLPHSGQGVRTRISDDRVWLAFATATYVVTSGDSAILAQMIPFIDGPLLTEQQHDAYFQASSSCESATLFEHCARALEQTILLTGRHGLPLMGTGDWNDGMDRVAEKGRGESVWLAWLLIRTIDLFASLAEQQAASIENIDQQQAMQQRAQSWRAHAGKVKTAIEAYGWDGKWYRRASFDDGSWLGSTSSDECWIDAIAQSWAVLSQQADPQRSQIAMESLEQWLLKPEQKLALLFTPPFDFTAHNPGYIKAYPAGLRENGGQYSHAAMWTILAYCKMNEGSKAFDLFSMLNPINHSGTAKDMQTYKVEPYVMAADVASVAPYVGRGGWTWYTGAASWMYRAGIEGILGITRQGNHLIVAPCLPAHWPGFEARILIEDTDYHITVKQSCWGERYLLQAELDGVKLRCVDNQARVPLAGGEHILAVDIELVSIKKASSCE